MAAFTIVRAWYDARISRDEAGASLIEYALLVGLIAIICIGGITALGGSVGGMLDGVGIGL
jgi:pilus assembly protein Flp/PilA